MTGRFQRIEEVFSEAIDLPAEERVAFVDRACAGDPDLRAEVLALLGAADGAAPALRATIARAVDRATAPVALGGRIGPYRVIEPIGEGGMGAVLLAERDDAEYSTRVAIKVLHRGLAGEHAVARFRDERQILATLEHPGIVRLLDGGRTDDGLPYLVMEHVRGEPITTWAEARSLGVRARVLLFLKVCAAVQYAHGMLVVHRDIKPSNVLVTSDGEPKLLDFGIAKLLDPTAQSEARTRTGATMLTPEYASPEQARGEPVSTATDVYSLGALLYELLTGSPAHRFAKGGLDALRVICEVEPKRPSTVAPRDRRRAIAGDLDNIVLKALQKEPARRYASVEQLADDLRRHLDGLPVAARTATLAYRTGKLLRRHRGAAAATLVVMTALASSTVVSLRQARRADEQARRADEQARRADEQARRAERRFAEVRKLANALLFDVDDNIRDLAGATKARELVVSRALEYLDGLAGEAKDDPALSRELAFAYMRIGDIQGNPFVPNLGRSADGLASYAKAKQIVDGLVASGHDDAGTRKALASVLYGRAFLSPSGPARDDLQAAVHLVETAPRDLGLDPRLVSRGYVALAMAEMDLGELAAADQHAKQCNDYATRWSRTDPTPDAPYWMGIALELRAQARALEADPESAERDTEGAEAIFAKLAREHPESGPYVREQVTALMIAAATALGTGDASHWLADTGDPAAAEAAMRKALPIAERLAVRDAEDKRASVFLALTVADLAAAVAERDAGASIPLFQRALALEEALSPDIRREGEARDVEAFTHCLLARPLAAIGRRAEALEHARLGVEARKRAASGAASTLRAEIDWLACRHERARVRHLVGDDAGAATELGEVLAEVQARVTAHPADIRLRIGSSATYATLAAIRPAEACDLEKRAVEAWASWPGTPTSFTRRRAAELERLAAAACARK